MNMFKKNGGFTLVELIVVIAILAILAAVAIPAYSGYITKANDTAVLSDMEAIKTAAMAANAKAGQIGTVVIDAEGNTITVNGVKAPADEFLADFELFFGTGKIDTTKSSVTSAGVATIELKAAIAKWNNSKYADTTKANGATWTGSEWKTTVDANKQ